MAKREKKRWEAKSYKSGDEKSIIELFEKVFGKSMANDGNALEHWRWEYMQNPVDDIAIILAWDQQRLVGQYTVSPVMLSVDGNDMHSTLSHDTMTDPEYQGQGIFTKLAKALFSNLADNDYISVFGFPNGNSIYGFINKLDWRLICAPSVYLRLLTPEHVFKDKLNLPQIVSRMGGNIIKHTASLPENLMHSKEFRGMSINRETEFGKWADELWNKCRHQHRLWVVRNAKYLNWRYVNKPHAEYEIYSAWSNGDIAGYVVTCRENKNIGVSTFIMDLVVDENHLQAAHALLHRVITIAIERNDSLVSSIVMPSSPLKKIFYKHLFLKLPEKLFPQELYFGGLLFPNTNVGDYYYDANSWGISWGDNDVI